MTMRSAALLAALMLMGLLAAACSGAAHGNVTQGNFNGLPEALMDGRVVMSTGAGYGGNNGIHATGVGVVKGMPDVAVVSLGVEAFAESVEEARTQAAEAMEGIIAFLREADVDDDDIQTQYFNIQPEYNYQEIYDGGYRRSERKLVGYRVTNQLTVKVRDLDKVGQIIDGTVQAGGNATRVNSIYFMLEDGSELEERARRLALRDARQKAEVYASELGVTRGDLVYVSESSYPVYPMAEARAMDAALAPGALPQPQTTVMPGEIEVRVTVQTVWDIVN